MVVATFANNMIGDHIVLILSLQCCYCCAVIMVVIILMIVLLLPCCAAYREDVGQCDLGSCAPEWPGLYGPVASTLSIQQGFPQPQGIAIWLPDSESSGSNPQIPFIPPHSRPMNAISHKSTLRWVYVPYPFQTKQSF